MNSCCVCFDYAVCSGAPYCDQCYVCIVCQDEITDNLTCTHLQPLVLRPLDDNMTMPDSLAYASIKQDMSNWINKLNASINQYESSKYRLKQHIDMVKIKYHSRVGFYLKHLPLPVQDQRKQQLWTEFLSLQQSVYKNTALQVQAFGIQRDYLIKVQQQYNSIVSSDQAKLEWWQRYYRYILEGKDNQLKLGLVWYDIFFYHELSPVDINTIGFVDLTYDKQTRTGYNDTSILTPWSANPTPGLSYLNNDVLHGRRQYYDRNKNKYLDEYYDNGELQQQTIMAYIFNQWILQFRDFSRSYSWEYYYILDKTLPFVEVNHLQEITRRKGEDLHGPTFATTRATYCLVEYYYNGFRCNNENDTFEYYDENDDIWIQVNMTEMEV